MGSAGETVMRSTIDLAGHEANVLASPSVMPMVLKAVVELNILEIIAEAGPHALLSASHIVSQLPTKNPNAAAVVDRMLRLLACYEVLTHSLRSLPDGAVERLYGLTPAARCFLKNQDGLSLASLILLNQDKITMEPW